MSQYPLSLVFPAVFSQDNFTIAACNKSAYDWVMAWPNWPQHSLILHGESGCGKTHLASIWAQRSGAQEVRIEDVNTVLGSPGSWPLWLESIESIGDETALFHLINSCKEHGRDLLLTSRLSPVQCSFALPDLRSRILAMPSIPIDPPDDEALAACLRKQFSDAQLKVEEDVIAYALAHMERSFASARALVERLDREALASKKTITIPFVRGVLERTITTLSIDGGA